MPNSTLRKDLVDQIIDGIQPGLLIIYGEKAIGKSRIVDDYLSVNKDTAVFRSKPDSSLAEFVTTNEKASVLILDNIDAMLRALTEKSVLQKQFDAFIASGKCIILVVRKTSIATIKDVVQALNTEVNYLHLPPVSFKEAESLLQHDCKASNISYDQNWLQDLSFDGLNIDFLGLSLLIGLISNGKTPENTQTLYDEFFDAFVSEHDPKSAEISLLKAIAISEIPSEINSIASNVYNLDKKDIDPIIFKLEQSSLIQVGDNAIQFANIHFAAKAGHLLSRYEDGLSRTALFLSRVNGSTFIKQNRLLTAAELDQIRLFEKGLVLSDELRSLVNKSRKSIQRSKILKMTALIGVIVVMIASLLIVIKSTSNNTKLEGKLNKAIVKIEKLEAAARKASINTNSQSQSLKEDNALLEKTIRREDSLKARNAILNSQLRYAYRKANMLDDSLSVTKEVTAFVATQLDSVQMNLQESFKAQQELKEENIIDIATGLAKTSILEPKPAQKRKFALNSYMLAQESSSGETPTIVMKALLDAQTANIDQNRFEMIGHANTRITDIFKANDIIYSLGDDGLIKKWYESEREMYPFEIVPGFIYYYKEGKMDIIERSLNSFNVLNIGTNDKETSLVYLGDKKFIQIKPSSDEYYELYANKLEGKVLAIFAKTDIWEVYTQTQILRISAKDPTKIEVSYTELSIAISDIMQFGGDYIALVGDELYKLTENSMTSFIADHPDKISALAIDRVAKNLAIGYNSGEIRRYSVENGEPFIQSEIAAHQSRVSTLTYTLGGQLISGAFDKHVRIWMPDDTSVFDASSFQTSTFVTTLYFDENSQLLMIGEMDGSLSYHPLDAAVIANRLCESPVETMTEAEWNYHVGPDISYDPYKCDEQ
ncbi:MAG: hypothetical protein JXQ90_01665 [Cyclobacteriaceae bacterium]